MQVCPKCKTTVIDSNKNCSSCDFELDKIICNKCSEVLHLEADMCDACGFYLGKELLLITSFTPTDEQLINGRYRILDREELLVKDSLPNHQTFYSKPITNSNLLNIYRKLARISAVPHLYDAFSWEGDDYILLKLNKDDFGQNIRTLKEGWIDLTDKEKINVLRDWAYLYKLLSEEFVLSSIFDTYNLYLDDDLNIKIKMLKLDDSSSTSLEQLGKVWAGMIFLPATTYIEYSKYRIGEIIRYLIEGKIDSIDRLIDLLDALLSEPISLISHGAVSNVGKKRTNNEDNFYAITLKLEENGFNRNYAGNRGLYIVCDGMGGHESGEVASATAVMSIRTTILPALAFSLNYEDMSQLIQEAIVNQANENVFQLNEKQNRQMQKRMGTTVATAVLLDNKLYTAHVGDSRIYLLTKDKLEQITEDHNVAMKNYRDGIGTLKEALNNSRTNWGKVLTQALGPKGADSVYPEINTLNINEDSYLILCSDGLTDMVDETTIEELVKKNWSDPKIVAQSLVEKANENGGKDNITVLSVKLDIIGSFFPVTDYADIFYQDEVYLHSDSIDLPEGQEPPIEGLIVDPD